LLLVVASHSFFLSALLVETRIILGSQGVFPQPARTPRQPHHA
jgi:hypothetical protein